MRWSLVLALVVVLVHATAVAAQDRRWEIEGAAGVLAAQPASAGTTTLPPPGPSIVTSLPTFPSRSVPSWFFGDGASLLNGVLEEFQRSSRLAPLDPMFAPLPTARPAAFALRVRRWINARTAFEISVDGFAGSPLNTGGLVDVVDKSSDTFLDAFHDLFDSGPFSHPTVVVGEGTGRGPHDETSVTAAFNRDVGRLGAWQPYLTLGGGVVVPQEFVFGATLSGRYTTAILGEVPIEETDAVSVNVTRSTVFTTVIGGGLRHDLSPKWAVRVDARMLLGPDPTRIRLDATPSVARGTPAGFIESFTNPAIQFSNDPATGRVSSLSGAPLSAVDVFKGGWIARTVLGVSIARRF
jgi:hypothetical protein